MIKYYSILLFSILLTSGIQAMLKIISVKYDGNILHSLYDPRLYITITLYVFALAAWFISASKIQFTVLIPANILTVVLGGIIGYLIFDEPMGGRKMIAYIIIIFGIVLLMTDQ